MQPEPCRLYTVPVRIQGRLALAVSVVLLAPLLSRPTHAQDPELEAVLLLPREVLEAGDVSTRSLQLYRLPIGFTLRDLEQRRWGLRLTLPVSLGLYEARAATDLEDLLERLQAITVVPGVELQLRAGPHWVVRPFGEVGVGKTTAGTTETLFAAGVRAAGRYHVLDTAVTLGGAVRYASDRSSRTWVEDYTTVELGIDLQAPLGFVVGPRRASGGLYGIARLFPDLSFTGTPAEGLEVDRVYEVGLSFSTDPVLEVWGLRLPWIALGYRFGDLFNGLRVSLSFPF